MKIDLGVRMGQMHVVVMLAIFFLLRKRQVLKLFVVKNAKKCSFFLEALDENSVSYCVLFQSKSQAHLDSENRLAKEIVLRWDDFTLANILTCERMIFYHLKMKF